MLSYCISFTFFLIFICLSCQPTLKTKQKRWKYTSTSSYCYRRVSLYSVQKKEYKSLNVFGLIMKLRQWVCLNFSNTKSVVKMKVFISTEEMISCTLLTS
ncbi:hypothetical protein BDF14DRAFT_580273 [Spinellus fusiger]|nr:hypothetical protein BDF14DRAFT_580273 [Spinellus fusiger]